MFKVLSTITVTILISACSPEVTIKPVPVTSYTRANKALDDCDRLGQVKVKYEANTRLTQRENKLQAQEVLKQQAYDEYRANNIVILHTRHTEGSYRQKAIVSGLAIAYMCYDSEKNQ